MASIDPLIGATALQAQAVIEPAAQSIENLAATKDDVQKPRGLPECKYARNSLAREPGR